MDRSGNSTLILENEQRTADTITKSKGKVGLNKEDIIDEKNTLVLNGDEEVLNSTLNDYVAMLSGTSSKESMDLDLGKKVPISKKKHLATLSPPRSLQSLSLASIKGKIPTKSSSRSTRKPSEQNLVSESPKPSVYICGSTKSVDWKNGQTKGKDTEKIPMKRAEAIVAHRAIKHKKSDSWDKGSQTPQPTKREDTDAPMKGSQTPNAKSTITTVTVDSNFKRMAEKSGNAIESIKSTPASKVNAQVSSAQKNRCSDTKTPSQSEIAKISLKQQEKTPIGENPSSPSPKNINLYPNPNLNIVTKLVLPNRDSSGSIKENKINKSIDKSSPSRNIKALVSPRGVSKEDALDIKAYRIKGNPSLLGTPSKRKTISPFSTKIAVTPAPIGSNKKGVVSTTHIDLFAETPKANKETELSVTIHEVDAIYNQLKNKIAQAKLEPHQNKKIIKAFNDMKNIMMNTASLLK